VVSPGTTRSTETCSPSALSYQRDSSAWPTLTRPRQTTPGTWWRSPTPATSGTESPARLALGAPSLTDNAAACVSPAATTRNLVTVWRCRRVSRPGFVERAVDAVVTEARHRRLAPSSPSTQSLPTRTRRDAEIRAEEPSHTAKYWRTFVRWRRLVRKGCRCGRRGPDGRRYRRRQQVPREKVGQAVPAPRRIGHQIRRGCSAGHDGPGLVGSQQVADDPSEHLARCVLQEASD
jgi:hypothetical protein